MSDFRLVDGMARREMEKPPVATPGAAPLQEVPCRDATRHVVSHRDPQGRSMLVASKAGPDLVGECDFVAMTP